jgi:hypothetical protein
MKRSLFVSIIDSFSESIVSFRNASGDKAVEAKDNIDPQGPPASEPDQVCQYLRGRLNKLTAHVKQKSVDGNRLIKADREEDSSGCVAYL